MLNSRSPLKMERGCRRRFRLRPPDVQILRVELAHLTKGANAERSAKSSLSAIRLFGGPWLESPHSHPSMIDDPAPLAASVAEHLIGFLCRQEKSSQVDVMVYRGRNEITVTAEDVHFGDDGGIALHCFFLGDLEGSPYLRFSKLLKLALLEQPPTSREDSEIVSDV